MLAVGLGSSHSPAAGPAPRAPIPPARVGPWRRVKRGCLRAFQAGLEATGLASLYVRLRKVTGTTILNFHSVAYRDQVRWIDPRYHMKPHVFERQMRFLSARRNPVSLSRLVQALEEGRDLPPRTVVVTLDDGYLDHLTVAAPILRKYRIPATFFVPTGYVARAENQWVDRLFSAFRTRTRNDFQWDGRRFDLSRADQEREAFRAMEAVLLTATYPERLAHLQSVDDQLRPEEGSPRLTLDWIDVRNLQKLSPDFEIGGHSRDHIDLSTKDGEAARREISDCADDLRRELGAGSRHFSYPYERWTPAVQDQVRNRGFRSGLGAGPGFLITLRSDRYALPRLDPVAHRSTLAFVTSGAYPDLSRALTGRA
jgi:peptidoglycan/xylan/chitin deacetylase (PgdA/CDA1 family)